MESHAPLVPPTDTRPSQLTDTPETEPYIGIRVIEMGELDEKSSRDDIDVASLAPLIELPSPVPLVGLIYDYFIINHVFTAQPF
jgi:hypothetical protein